MRMGVVVGRSADHPEQVCAPDRVANCRVQPVATGGLTLGVDHVAVHTSHLQAGAEFMGAVRFDRLEML